MAFFSQIRLMLWKNWILQRRRICVSIFEILLPLFFVAILVLLRSVVDSKPVEKPTIYDKEFVRTNWQQNSVIGYTPPGKEVDKLMTHMRELYIHDFVSTTIKSFEDEKAMEDYSKLHSDKIELCITFLNVKDGVNDSLPNDLRYAVRPPSDTEWRTRMTYDQFQTNTPRIDFNDYSKRSVLVAERLMGESLIKYWQSNTSGNPGEMNHTVWTQRMAYPPYVKDPMIDVIQTSLPNFLIFSLILCVVINTKNLVYEKERKLKESMKLMGLKASAHWVSWFITFCIYLIPVLVVYAIMLGAPIIADKGPILQQSDPSVVFVFLLSYGIATITFCFMISAVVQKANVASAVSGILFFLTYCPNSYLHGNYQNLGRQTKLSISLLTNCGMIFGAHVIGMYEGTGEGVHWNNFHHPATVDDDLSLLDCMIMLMVDSVLHLVVFWYLDNVRPGEFGVPKPYYFCFTRAYWFGSTDKTALSRKLSRVDSMNEEKRLRFEEEPANLKPGITIKNLTKVFGKDTAVNGLSLNMYEGQISVLLGHNGAGKTTTMSMLTGFISPTSGSAIVNGYNITDNLDGVRSSLGLCPQHNILFDALTVKEHLQFFARLKGATNEQAEKEIDPLLTEVGLLGKKNELSVKLSGGQKRKLSVAIALIAGSKVVILDEPSSGMDPAARRQTWTALQNHREGRTILLTTHYMDEADVLGDRIAIMAEGVVKCCGTSMFLKKLYGAGYHLVIVKSPSCIVDKITEVITSHINTAKLETIINQEVTYLLPEKETAKFPPLFMVLDQEKDRLGISSFGTSATTMEEVFLKVGESAHHHDETGDEEMQDVNGFSGHGDTGGVAHGHEGANEKTPLTEEAPGHINMDGTTVRFSTDEIAVVDMNQKGDSIKLMKGYEKNFGFALEIGKMRGIFVKKALHTWRNRTITLVQLLLPVIFAILALAIDKLKPESENEPPLTLNLSPFESTIIPTTAGFDATLQRKQLEKVYGQQFGGKDKVESFDVSKYDTYGNYTIDQTKTMGISTFNKRVIIGLELETKTHDSNGPMQAISHYNGQPLHSEFIGLNYLMNALLQFYLDSSYSLQAVLHPLPKNSEESAKDTSRQNNAFGFNLAFLISFGMAFLTTLFVHYLIKERQVGSKHLQVVSGVDPISYWIPTFLWDLICYFIPTLCMLIVFAAYGMTAFTGGSRGLIFMLLLLMYGFAVLPFMYMLQFLFTQPPTGVNVIITLNIISGLVCLLTVMILRIPSLNLESTANALDWVFLLLFPNYSVAQSIIDMYNNYHINKVCQDAVCIPGILHPCCKDSCTKWCYDYTSNYLSMEKPGIGINILVFFVTGIFYFVLVLLIDYHVLQKIFYFFWHSRTTDTGKPAEGAQLFEDSDVAAERERINSTTPQELSKTDSLLLINLFKKYGNLTAVDHTCLGIPTQECFGLLGQNGAGKTTTFKMLTGDVMLSGGNAYLDGNDVCKNIKKVQSNLGYCPQFDALLDQMTGRETLTMYGRLKGVPEKHLKDVVNNLIEILMLVPHADKLVGAYSGGNKRKLSTAVALVGMPQFIMLDEPSAGMDPKSRRQLWNVLAMARASGHTLILTSHSMEECDALCTRLAIMVNGRFVCLGSPQHLKTKFGQGYTLIVKQGLLEDGTRPPIEPLVNYVAEHLPGIKVFDDHQGYLHFQVPDSSVRLANVFGLMEATKDYLNVQDYSVHQTTLEQVFLTFTKAQIIVPENPRKKGCFGFC